MFLELFGGVARPFGEISLSLKAPHKCICNNDYFDHSVFLELLFLLLLLFVMQISAFALVWFCVFCFTKLFKTEAVIIEASANQVFIKLQSRQNERLQV